MVNTLTITKKIIEGLVALFNSIQQLLWHDFFFLTPRTGLWNWYKPTTQPTLRYESLHF